MYKNLLLLCDAHAGIPAAIGPAMQLAGKYGASVTVCTLLSEEVVPIAAAAIDAPVAVAPEIRIDKEQIRHLREKAAGWRDKITGFAERYGTAVDWRELVGDIETLSSRCAKFARLYDLCLFDGPREDEGVEWTVIMEELIRNSGRPCLVVPHAFKGETFAANVQICWDGSAPASRAVHDVLPLLKAADKALIVEMGEAETRDEASAQKLRAHLKDHGIDAAMHAIAAQDETSADTLAAHADDEDCDLLVMGAFNQGWLRRLVFGSVTDQTIQDPKLPVFISR